MATKQAERESAPVVRKPPQKSQEHRLSYLLGVVYHDDQEEARERPEKPASDRSARHR